MAPKSMRCALLTIATAVLIASASVSAWHGKGHMATALVAYKLLRPAMQTRVQELLRRNPAFDEWNNRLAGTPDADKPALRFALAAAWADDIKNDKNYTDNNDAVTGTRAGQNIGYRDKLRHRYWHFVDRPFSDDGSPLENAPVVNAQERIELFRSTLASTTASDAVKSYDLVWLLHLVGDVHQPLHCTSRFSSALPHGDRGGNDVKLNCSGCGAELHGFWDGIVGETSRATVAASFAATLAAAPSSPANDTDVDHWVTNSFGLARSAVYLNPPIGATPGPFSIPAEYRAAALDVGKTEIALGGARLAKLINDNLR